MGGTHVAGAIGFFLTFALFDQAISNTANRFVLPIDAADYFLRTLAGQKDSGSHQRRADVLFIDVEDEEIVLSPVEIKCYGLQGESVGERFPSPGAAKFDEALRQLEFSFQILKKIELQAAEVADADRVLWLNSFATLVDTAARLSPVLSGSRTAFASRLSALIDGRMRVRAGKPLLVYLQHDGRTDAGETFYVDTIGGPKSEVGGLVADTRTVFEALNGVDRSSLVTQWRHLAEWSIADSGSTLARELDKRESSDQTAIESDTELSGSGEVDLEKEEIPENSSKEVTEGIVGDGVRVKVGTLLGTVGEAVIDFWPSNTKLNQMNVGIVGDLGTGKTELVKTLVAQIREQAKERQSHVPTSMLIFDYKGDFQQESFVSHVGGVVLKPHEIPVNIFLPVTSDYSRLPYQQAAAFVDVLRKIYKGVGPVQASMLNESIRELYDGNENIPPTLAEVRERYLGKSTNADSVSAILDSFVLSRVFSDERTMLKPFGELLEGKVLIVALDRLGQDQSAKNALVAIFLNLYYDNMLKTEKPGFQGTDPQLRYLKSFLLVDEAINIMRYDFQVLMDLMLQGRQFGHGVMLSSQYLSHFRSGKENYGQPLRTWFIHKVPSVTGKELASLGLPDLHDYVPSRIPDLGQHEVLYKSLGCDDGRFARVRPYYEIYGPHGA